MKRSAVVSLIAMGAAALSACEDKTIITSVYNNVDECIASEDHSRQKCLDDYDKAVASHQKTAPAYKSKDDCEAEFGKENCTESTEKHATGGGHFIPFMLGYMLGGSSRDANPANVSAQGLYKKSNKSDFVNAGGTTISKGTGTVRFSSRSSKASTPAVRTTTLSRGGFGARSFTSVG